MIGLADLHLNSFRSARQPWDLPPKVRFAPDSLLEEGGFELVWGFSCQAVVLGCADRFFSLIARQVSRLEENRSQRWWDVIGEKLFFWFG
jgi:hypothetical protein